MTDIQFKKGDTKVFAVLCTRFDPDTGLNEPVNPNKAWFTAKRRTADLDADAIIQKDSTGVDVVITGNQVQVTIDPADTEDFPYRILQYDVQIRESDGSITTVERGQLELVSHTTQERT